MPAGQSDPVTVSAHTLGRLLGVPADGHDPEAMLALARLPRHKLAPTLLSVWQRDGRSLPAKLLAELTAHRRRVETYRETWTQIRRVSTEPYVVKGPTIAAHYPDGVLRAAGDLDVVCRRTEHMWSVAARLLDLGWRVGAFTLTAPARRDERADVLLELRLPQEDALGLPYQVELRTTDVATSLRQRPQRLPDPHGSAIATALVVLLAERWERAFTSRDVLDVSLLAAHQTESDGANLRAALDQTGLWPEWAEMSLRAARLGWHTTGWLAVDRARVRRVRAARVRAFVTRWTHPVRAMACIAQATVEADRGRPAEWISDLLHQRVGAHRVFDQGLPTFGVPLPDRPESAAVGGLRIARRGAHLVADTPVGSFLMVSGACRQAWIEQVTSDDEEAAGGATRVRDTGAGHA